MELRHLRYFCAVAEHRSFTAAAKQLNVSQSGVSGQVRDLEGEMGVSLLRRNQREVTLTPEGVVFFNEAQVILSRAGRAVALTLGVSQGRSGSLTVGLCGPVTASFLPKMIRQFRRRYPGVLLALRDYVPSAQVGALLNGQIDIGFARSVPSDARHLVRHEVLFREPVIVALPKAHPLAHAESISVKQLAAERLILFCREGAPEIFDAIVSMCQRAKFSPKIADTPSSWQSILTMVESGEGLGLVPQCVQHLRANDVVFRPLRDGRCLLDAMLVWRRNDSSVVQEIFLDLVRLKRSDVKTKQTAREM